MAAHAAIKPVDGLGWDNKAYDALESDFQEASTDYTQLRNWQYVERLAKSTSASTSNVCSMQRSCRGDVLLPVNMLHCNRC
jgi:hypothetical protein